MNRKIGISTSKLQFAYGDKEAIRIAKEAGANTIDFFTHHLSVADPQSIYSKKDEHIIRYFTELYEYAKKQGIEIAQTHGRGRVCMNNPELDRECLENARRDLLVASVLKAPVCVMHGGNISEFGTDVDPEYIHKSVYEAFNKVLVWAKEYNVKIATETTGFMDSCNAPDFFADVRELKKCFDRIADEGNNAEFFSVCVDTGHTNTAQRFDNPGVGDAIRMLGRNISCLHLHDNNGLHDQHLPLYAGNIDWDDVFDALDEVDYNGVYNLEINLSKAGEGRECEFAKEAINILKNLLEKRYSKI